MILIVSSKFTSFCILQRFFLNELARQTKTTPSLIMKPNVGTPLENFQATNKFYVDALVEAATAGDKALRKIRDGTFASDGEIDMNGNSINGLPNPVDKDATANKNYVDNGGAIIKNPDGSFTAVSDIDFIGYRLKNLSNPKDDRDAVNKIYVDKQEDHDGPISLT